MKPKEREVVKTISRPPALTLSRPRALPAFYFDLPGSGSPAIQLLMVFSEFT